MDAESESEYLTPQQYLERERLATAKSEYVDGVMVAMAGATQPHIALTTTLSAFIFFALRGGRCHVYANEMKVRAHPNENYFYPDLVVVCGEDVFRDEKKELLTNPVLIIEVLSPSTEAFDRGEKFRQYQQIPSLREYVLVAQDKARIERFVRQGEGSLWTYSLTEGLDATVAFEAGPVSISLGELYGDILPAPLPVPGAAEADVPASDSAG